MRRVRSRWRCADVEANAVFCPRRLQSVFCAGNGYVRVGNRLLDGSVPNCGNLKVIQSPGSHATRGEDVVGVRVLALGPVRNRGERLESLLHLTVRLVLVDPRVSLRDRAVRAHRARFVTKPLLMPTLAGSLLTDPRAVRLLGLSGASIACLINGPFLAVALTLWVMGVMYNVPPVRTKELPYLDVLSESVNNPLRLLLGWFVLIPDRFPPLSLILAYWMVGAFFMATKRFLAAAIFSRTGRRSSTLRTV